MLTFRNTNIFFGVLLLATVGTNVYTTVPFFVYALLVLVYSMIVFYGCYVVSSNFFLPVISAADTDKKQIAISFDDGPVNQFTQATLQVLQDNKVEAAFFCIGNRVAANGDLLKQVYDAGHVLGNHSYSHHFWFDLFSSRKMLEDMRQADQAMKYAAGIVPKLFRPPYGVINPNLKKAIIKGGYTTVGWSVRSMDTVIKNESKLLGKITAALKPGAIFLFHDTSKTTLAVLPTFIKTARESGYEFVRLDKMLNLDPYA